MSTPQPDQEYGPYEFFKLNREGGDQLKTLIFRAGMMWIDDLKPGEDWMGPWDSIHQCGGCNGLITEDECPFCSWRVPPYSVFPRIVDGEELTFVATVTHGAFTAVPNYILGMMQSEWNRSLNDDHWVHKIPADLFAPASSQRTAIVLFFWTLFESLMNQFYIAVLAHDDKGGSIRNKGMIGNKLVNLHRNLFGKTFYDDLKDQGHGIVSDHLRNIHTCRNNFIHGEVSAITDDLVQKTVELLPNIQLAWVDLYNLRCRGLDKRIPLWGADAVL